MTRVPREVEMAAKLAKGAPMPLCALALDVLSRQAEAKALLAGEGFVRSKSEAHKVDEQVLGGTNIVDLLERGPKEAGDYALVMALAIRGLDLDDDTRIARFLRHADWLTFATPYPAYEAIEPVLGEEAEPIWALVQESLSKMTGSPREQAVAAMRRASLLQAGHAPGSEASDAPDERTLSGRLDRPPAEGFRAVLRLVTGYALLQWLFRGLQALVRYERRATVEQVAGGLLMRSTTRLLGREVRVREENFTYEALTSIGATTRFPALPFLLGAVFFGVGVLVGGFWLFEGVRSGETVLLLAGAGVVGLGAALDLAISTLWPARKGRVALDIGLAKRPGWRLSQLTPASAADFARSVAKAAGRR